MKGVIKILDSRGHSTVEWDETKPQQQEAKEVFDNHIAAGYMAFVIDQNDKSQGRHIREFEPDAGEIILTPPIYGG